MVAVASVRYRDINRDAANSVCPAAIDSLKWN